MSQNREGTPSDGPEPLSAIVHDTLEALLSGENPVSRALRRQLPFTEMKKDCPCGCASVGLWVDTTKVGPAPPHDGRPAVSGDYVDTDAYAGVLVWTDDGYLTGLEVHTWQEEPIRSWPDLDHLEVNPQA